MSDLTFSDFLPVLRPSSLLIWGFVLTILGIAIRTIILTWRRSVTARKAIATARAIHDESRQAGGLIAARNYRKNRSRGDRGSATDRRADTRAGDLWREFDETLVESREGLRNTVPANYYFNARNFAPDLIDNRFLHAVPALLTGWGLLGTFLGLATGLSGLDLATDSPEEMRQSIETLVLGASLGFTSSVWGIFFSLVVNALQKWREGTIDKLATNLANDIDEAFEHQGPEQSLIKIEDYTSASSAALEELHEKIGTSLQEAVAGMSQDLQDALTKSIESAMAPSMDKIARTSVEQTQEVFSQLVEKFTESFTGIGDQQARQLNAASDALNSSLTKVSATVYESITGMNASIQLQAAALEEQRAEFSEELSALTSLVERVSTAVESSATMLEGGSHALESSARNLLSSATELGQNSEGLKQGGELLKTAVAEAVATLESAETAHERALGLLVTASEELDRLSSDSRRASSAVEQAASGLTTGLQAFQREQKQYVSDIATRHDELHAAMAGHMRDYTAQVVEQTGSRMQAWDRHSRGYAADMLAVTQALRDVVEELGGRTDAVH